MEALRTKMDNLQWEVQRLQVENRKLREQNPEASERVDGEVELATARSEIAGMEERLKKLEQQLEESDRRADEAEGREASLREKAGELTAAREDGDEQDEAARREAHKVLRQMEESLRRSGDRVQELETRLVQAEAAYSAEKERDELERYRSLEEERRRGEAREARLLRSMDAVEEELRATKAAAVGAEEKARRLGDQVQILAGEVDASRDLVDSLTAEKGRPARGMERWTRGNSAQRSSSALAESPTSQEQRCGNSTSGDRPGASPDGPTRVAVGNGDGGEGPPSECWRAGGATPVTRWTTTRPAQVPRDSGAMRPTLPGGQPVSGDYTCGGRVTGHY